MDLASKDSYIQKLASKVISQRNEEPKRKAFVHFTGKKDIGPPNKKKKSKKTADGKTPRPQHHQPPVTAKPEEKVLSFSTVDVLRKRLHEKMEESRGQGTPKNAHSEEVQAKRAKRKLERERKKRKRKEFLMKKLAEQSGQEVKSETALESGPEEPQGPAAAKRNETAVIFNKVEMVEDRYVDKMLKKKTRKESVKGKIMPLTGKNYKRLLSQVEARKTQLEELREKDEGKALEMEKKIKWTNMLYRAEGVKIKDDEDMLRASLKKKEKWSTQRKKRWGQRCENIVEKMQKQQDKRKKNIQRRKQVRIEKKKTKARKKGRILPEDLKKAAI